MTVSLDNTKFKHYRGDTTKGGVTLGWTYEGENLYVACAICSDKDQFVKKEGREIVMGRLEKESNGETTPYSSTIPLTDIRDYLRGNVDQAFPTITFRTAERVISNIQLEDLKYDLLARVATDVFFG